MTGQIREDRSWSGKDEELLQITEFANQVVRSRRVVAINGTNGANEGHQHVAPYEYSEEEKAWRKDALCRGLDGNMFFPERGHSMLPAYAVCRGCSVRMECLQSAIETGDRWGVRGGFTPEERKKISKRMKEEGVGYKEASDPFDERRYKRLLRALTRVGLNSIPKSVSRVGLG